MNTPILILCMVNLLAVGLLPRFFFRPGRMNVGWWLTAGPFVLLAAMLLAGTFGFIETAPAVARWAEPMAGVAAVLAAMSGGLMGMTVGAHRVPVAMWYQEDDAPAGIVTWGPYARIRHPFYASYILTFAAGALAMPHWTSGAVLLFGTLQLARTARREERRLLASAFGADYVAYMSRTGRFVPRMRRRRSSRVSRRRTPQRNPLHTRRAAAGLQGPPSV